MNDWTLPITPDTYLRVITCTDSSTDFACLICTLIDVWAEDHEIDKVKYAAQIADKVRMKVEGGQRNDCNEKNIFSACKD